MLGLKLNHVSKRAQLLFVAMVTDLELNPANGNCYRNYCIVPTGIYSFQIYHIVIDNKTFISSHSL